MAGGNKGDLNQSRAKGDILTFPVYQSTHIYRGTMVNVDASGWAIQGIDTAGTFFAGIAEEEVDNSSGTDGALNIRVRRRGIFKMTLATTAAAGSLVGDLVYVDTAHSSSVNELVDIAANVSNHVLVGQVVRHGTFAECIAGTNSTEVWVDILGVANTAYSATFASAATLAAHTTGNGAADVGVEANTGFGATPTVQDALALLLKGRLSPSRLTQEDGTALTKWTAGATPGFQQLSNKETVLCWDGNASPTGVMAHFDFPDDLDGAAPVKIHYLAKMAGTTDTPVIVNEAYFNAGDTDCAGTDDEVDGGVTLTKYSMTIAADDVPDGPASLDVLFDPTDGQMNTDELHIYAIWAEYTKKLA